MIKSLISSLARKMQNITCRSLSPAEISECTGLVDHSTSPQEFLQSVFFAPPIICIRNNVQQFMCVDGQKRLNATIGNEKCMCIVISEPMTDIECGILRIYLNRQRQKTITEKFLWLSWLNNPITNVDMKSDVEQLGFSQTDVHDILLLQACGQSTINAVLSGSIHPQVAQDFSMLGEVDQQAFLKMFGHLMLSFQTQREFIEWLPQIAYSQSTTIDCVLNNLELTEMAFHPKITPSQKISRIRAWLCEKRCPEYTRVFLAWQDAVKVANRYPQNVIFTPSPGFEKNRVEIRVSVHSSQQAQQIFSTLNNVAYEQWQDIIDPFLGKKIP